MGKVYRFVEPVVLLLLSQRGPSCGYDLAPELRKYALTDAEIEKGALYRTLRQLEENGNVKSAWVIDDQGPARRIYRLTARGRRHLQEWAEVLDHLSGSMSRFVREAKSSSSRTARVQSQKS